MCPPTGDGNACSFSAHLSWGTNPVPQMVDLADPNGRVLDRPAASHGRVVTNTYPNLRHPMITLPMIMTLSLVAFFGLIAAVAGTGRRSRGSHRA